MAAGGRTTVGGAGVGPDEGVAADGATVGGAGAPGTGGGSMVAGAPVDAVGVGRSVGPVGGLVTRSVAATMLLAPITGVPSTGSQPGPQAVVHASANMTPNASAVAGRSAGSVASPAMTMSVTADGTAGALSASGSGASKACLNIRAMASPSSGNGNSPHSSS